MGKQYAKSAIKSVNITTTNHDICFPGFLKCFSRKLCTNKQKKEGKRITDCPGKINLSKTKAGS